MAQLLWRIITPDGTPLRDFAGEEILLKSEQEARSWLRPGDKVERVKR